MLKLIIKIFKTIDKSNSKSHFLTHFKMNNTCNSTRLVSQSSVTSMMSTTSQHLSIRDRSEAHKELFGFIYDIPKDAGLTNDDMVAIFREKHIDCQVQIKRDENRPFFSGRVKFTNSVHLRVATEKMRFFELTKANGEGRKCRFLPYVHTLSKAPPSASNSSLLLAEGMNPE